MILDKEYPAYRLFLKVALGVVAVAWAIELAAALFAILFIPL